MREAEAEIEKWDAWHSCAGMSRTEAKRRYISTLIETMKEYASGTQEARELVAELEFVWNQIKSQSGSSEDEDVDSPSRRLERAGLSHTQSFGSIPPGQSSRGSGGLPRSQSDPNQLRVLSPVSQRGSDDVVEGEEIDPVTGALVGPLPITQTPASEPEWRNRMEELLKHLSTEVAALREQLSSNHLLSSSSFSPSLTSRRRRIFYRISTFAKWLAWIIARQIMLDAGLILAVILWARWKGYKERTVEDWVRRRWNDLRRGLSDLDTWLRGTLTEVRLPGLSKVF